MYEEVELAIASNQKKGGAGNISDDKRNSASFNQYLNKRISN